MSTRDQRNHVRPNSSRSGKMPKKMLEKMPEMTSKSSRATQPKYCADIACLSGYSSFICDPSDLQSKQTADFVIQSVNRHLTSSCACIPLPRACFTRANAKMSFFFLNLQEFGANVAAAETVHCKQFFDLSPPADEKSDTAHIASALKSQPASRFDPNPLVQFVNVTSHEALMQPLVEAVQDWETGLTDADFRPSDACTLRVCEHLLTAFNVFQLYKLITHQETCARLVRKAASKPTEVLTSHCLNLQLALSIADRELAERTVRLASTLASQIRNKCQSDTFETAFFFLLKCDYEIRRGVFDSAAVLSSFIDSDFLKMLTVNRFFMRTYALYTASKYPADAIAPASNFEYFTEPLRSMLMLLKRWHRKIFDPLATDDKNDDGTDPLWLRYAAYDLFGKAFVLYSRFNTNCGTPLESDFLHNAFMMFCRRNCLLYWLRKILVMAAGIDRLTDRPEEAKHKVTNALELVKKRSSLKSRVWLATESILSPGSSPSDDFIVSKAPFAEVEAGVCLHGQRVNVFDLKKKTITMLSGSSGYESDDSFFQTTDYYSLVPENIPIYELDVCRLEALIELVKITVPPSVKRINTLNKISITNNVKVSLHLIRQVVKKIERPNAKAFNLLFKESLETGRELISSRQRFEINCMYLESYSAVNQIEKALTFAGSVLNKKSFLRTDCLEGYCSRMLFAEFCLRYAKLLASSAKSRRLEYNPAQVSDAYVTRSGLSNSVRFPSPVRSSRIMKVGPPPKAPKGKQPFQEEEMNEYFKQLGHETAKERTVFRNESLVRQSPVQIYKNFLAQSDLTLQKRHLVFETPVEESRRAGQASGQMVRNASGKNQMRPEAPAGTEPEACLSLVMIVSQIAEDDDKHHGIAVLLTNYLGSHPPVHIYRDLMSLASDYYFCKGDVWSSCYFTSERVSTAFRYRALRVAHKRDSKQKDLKCSPSRFEFKQSSYSELIEKTLKNCPRGWRILEIVAEEGKKPGPDLLLTRYELNRPPISLRIRSDEWKHKRNFMDELQEIIELSNNSIINKDPKSFWPLRKSLDHRMSKLLAGVEKAWLGPFAGLLLGKLVSDRFHRYTKAAAQQILLQAEKRGLRCSDTGVLELLVESSPVLSEEDFCSGVGLLFSFQADFLSACHAAVLDMASSFHPIAEPKTIFVDYKTSPVGLVLGPGLELFPWESLPCTRECRQEFFRIPSFRFLSTAIESFRGLSVYLKGVKSHKTYYLLNPTDNLSKTEERFKDKFGEQFGWKGCIGKAPDPLHLADGLENEDIYIFFGHGAGSSYYRSIPDNLEGVNVNTTSLVIGCSSGRLKHEGKDLEPYGIPYRFLLNGSPAYVGVLWDVTDQDIDAFADDMLARWMPQWNCKSQIGSRKEGVSLCRAAAEARNACRLKYLIGAAPVVYGLPIFARKAASASSAT